MRVFPRILLTVSADQVVDDEEDDFKLNTADFSEDDRTADTPNTPFSPGPGPARKKFPSELKTIKCTYEGCTKTFNRPIRLTAHLRTHTNDRAFACTYEGCDKAYFQDKHLQAHIKGSHTHERSFVCDWEGCGKSFLTSTRLKRHKDTHVGHERFRCAGFPPCNQTFRKHHTLQRHINSEHLQLAPYQCTFVDILTNTVCRAGFDGANGLRQHVERIHGVPKFFCPDCIMPGQFDMEGNPLHLGFVTEKEHQAHIRKEHAHCPFCDLKCRGQRDLQTHIEGQHSGTTLEDRKNIPCTYAGCDRRFTKQNNLAAHVRSVHLGERFICGTFDVSSYHDVAHFDDSDGCGSDFVSKQYLVDHIRVAHLGLSSVINANRKRASVSDIETDDDDEYLDNDFVNEEDYLQPGKRTTKKRGSRTKHTVMDDLIGVSYANDPKRNIMCPVFPCEHRFMRDYDLQVHLQSMHEGWIPNMAPAPMMSLPFSDMNASFQYPEPNMGNHGLFSQQNSFASTPLSSFDDPGADIDWELQRKVLEGGEFWIGSDDPIPNETEWSQDVREMRRLVG